MRPALLFSPSACLLAFAAVSVFAAGCLGGSTGDGPPPGPEHTLSPLSSFACPAAPPSAGGACDAGLSCGYDATCCDGVCADQVRCACGADGGWACEDGPACEGEAASALCPTAAPDTGDACEATGLACGYGAMTCEAGAASSATVCGCWEGAFLCLTELDACGAGAPALSTCPEEPPLALPAGVPVVDGLRCEYGEECCCDVCHPSLVCTGAGDGFACFNTDACLAPGCPGDTCPVEAPEPGGVCSGQTDCSYDEVCCPDGTCTDTMFCSCDEGGTWVCAAAGVHCPDATCPAEAPEPGGACEGQSGCGYDEFCCPDGTCVDTKFCSCDEGGAWICAIADVYCEPTCPAESPEPGGACEGQSGCSYDEFCCPDGTCTDTTFCSCDEGGAWICAIADVFCEEITCPDDPFDAPAGAYYADGLSCDYGEECCCGQCYPSISCHASEGSLACLSTDACFMPGCDE